MTKRWRLHASAALAIAAVAMTSPAAMADPPAHETPDATRAKLAAADRQVEALHGASAQVQALLRGARGARDPERALCLDGLLSRVHVAARYGRSLRDAIEAALGRGDRDAVEVEMRRLVHLGERGSRLLTEASRCGAPAAVTLARGTEIRVVVPSLPDATAYPRDPTAK